MAEEEGAPVEAPAEPPPPAPEEAPTPPAAEEAPAPPPAEAPPAEPPPPAPEEAATPAAEPPPPAPEEGASPAEPPKPSKSNLVMEKRTSTMSRVRLQEPGDVAPEEEKEIKPEGEKRKSDSERKKSDSERRKSDGERKKSDARTSLSTRGSLRGSTAMEGSKEGILRRRSDRPSKSKMAVGSVVSIRRTSGYGEYSAGGKVPKYANSYKLDSDNPFQVEKVEKILKEVLIEALEDLTYDTDKCPKQAKWASSAIRARIKEQEYDRYRFVVLVTIGEKRYHDMCCMFRFLWDIERDKYATFVHENMTVFATALCFGVYYE